MAAIELGAIYRIYNSDQSNYFCLNDPTDDNFVGYVSDITGLDSPGVRENAQTLSAASGGYQGPFWADRRPWTISGYIFPTMPITLRSANQELMEGVLMDCLQADGTMTWMPSDGIQKFVPYRNQQPYRSTTGSSNVNRNFQLACVTAGWRIMAVEESNPVADWSEGTTITVDTDNVGNVDGFFLASILGPCNGFSITNSVSGKAFVCTYDIPSGESVVVDLTGTYPDIYNATTDTDVSGYVSPTETDWSIGVVPGASSFVLADIDASGAGTTMDSTTEFSISTYTGFWT